MGFKDFSLIHRRLLHKAKSLVSLNIEDRKKIMVPEIANFFNTVSFYNQYDRLSRNEYYELDRMVKTWIDYLAFHSVIIHVPTLPLPGAEFTLKIRNKRKVLEGLVVNISGEKTIKVKNGYYLTHPKYNKQIKRSKNYLVHDENEVARIGDYVQIVECRPLSKKKHFRLASVLLSTNVKQDF